MLILSSGTAPSDSLGCSVTLSSVSGTPFNNRRVSTGSSLFFDVLPSRVSVSLESLNLVSIFTSAQFEPLTHLSGLSLRNLLAPLIGRPLQSSVIVLRLGNED